MPAQTTLAQIPLFAGLSRDQLDALAAFLRPRQYRKSSVIFSEGDPGTTFYLIEEGEVKLTITSPAGKEVILAFLGPGGFFGELALLDGGPRSATAVAKIASRLLVLEREQLLKFLGDHPRAAASLLAALSRRLRRATERISDAVFLDGPTRLAKILLQLTEAGSQPGPDGVLSSPRLTQEELAQIVGGTRESINRWLGTLVREGLVRRRRGLVTVLNPKDLRDYLARW
jgi:CRP/FNR family cyclic AMP-dependent transcriptional regulator